MALKEQINNDLKTALLGGNRFAGEVLRGLKAVMLSEEIVQNKRESGLDDATIEQLIAREVKKRNESATIYDGAGRPELAENERAEAKVMAKYLPKQLSETEINTVIARTISEMGVTSPAGFGQVIGAVKKELGNTADGALIAKLVKDALN
ncbi:GatB/YqeY [Candidatus Saccharibacteria bacterium CG11_big_fil_rev_8_21_14_0_20_41_19]|nr:GatB/YqeY domain-containing protein [Candidatus Saccharibacteria bacterium]OIP85724.1 MAG: GatB/YqeY [Candidatus Saccharibacteria bacterium CG2_30_41_52]PIQ70839.1 MAG: GatB/YqeY [Candidatus Saccharibacteria bacterium CG11_big_fil_rev_8_21_14_0_20_41_19]PIZ60722.1 MAG: GatB/YqeY [Candidatus Saccharibacteria bacterium CG_4_10_14_0_2_um_filter_41_11]PJC29577.1 MAG: GatB/YqeY [Candidatus Saccharibacteria bacterium CG_4_9_14_0_2_um_filter_41_9]PJE65763.1 MAG: GatB/YqeY [Candidatus Saccharibacte